MLLLLASQPSWRLTVWVLAWAKPPDGRRFAAAAVVAAAPVSSVRRRILESSLIVCPATRTIDCSKTRTKSRLHLTRLQMAKSFDVQPVDASFGAVITGI